VVIASNQIRKREAADHWLRAVNARVSRRAVTELARSVNEATITVEAPAVGDTTRGEAASVKTARTDALELEAADHWLRAVHA
jgi:hypothetical protein